ncbi:trifunctional serine/threonine-protein kinase/ATP-binding protein/sensor histidine kinase [Paraburkholderia sp. C35]|uniref:trifunctional serine/threonine-protein kinase/ATP-binding protein/sensor histidine kinase n=1 Tax=Paraburkholderia sp. C35 TaxID=2126993 RepID=UPI000D69FCA2|nr:trifunctional serine/threonine-protein kinase/ATP-binding protein/sensor histidine kinase [Paraburkholderia sp. C35]
MIDLTSRNFIDLSAGAQKLQRAVATDATSVLVVGRDNTTPASTAALQREYALRHHLHKAWCAVPLDMQPHGTGAVLILADPGGTALSTETRTDQPYRTDLKTYFALAVSLATATSEMHAAGVIHRALTPGSFLVDDNGRAHLVGFGFASCLLNDMTALPDADFEWGEASFIYMAPELGARMNVRVDERADLYSLGCILYELLTGVAPFENATDAAARVHAHATHRPRPPADLDPQVPPQLSALLMKLLEKAPGQRYANAASLLADLRRCDDLFDRLGHIPSFALDTHAALQSLQRADGVFGRDQEIDALTALYRCVADSGTARVAWVAGVSGIGKSTLLQEAVARVRRHDAPLLAAGKSEEGRRARPYAILVQALEPLLQYVLGCADDEFAQWRNRIREATGPVGRTLAGLLPTLTAVLGSQPGIGEAPDPQPSLERERVLQGLARLIACFATASRPLVLLLDDLQWADVGTLHVLERLLKQHAQTPLLFIGAFRGNEVGADHPLRVGPLAQWRDALRIDLGPLDEHALSELIALALHRDTQALAPLAAEIGRKTGRNPFFVRHLLRVLADEGALEYDLEAGAWGWHLERIMSHRGADNVVELLTHKLEQLPLPGQCALRVLACLGDRASDAALAVASALSEADAAQGLQAALDAGSVYRDGADWVFWHDRIREAAYASIPNHERAPLHLQIARRMLAARTAQADVFTLAAQVNLARPAVTDVDERLAFARLNLDAGRQAKAATAHHSALGLFRAALDFLGDDDATEDGLTARMLCGEAEFMTGALEPAEARLSALEAVAGDDIFGADLARLRAALYTTLGRYDLALEVGLAFLRKAGIDVPLHPSAADVDREYARLRGWLDEHGIEALRGLPIVADPLRRAITDIFVDLIPPALYTDQDLVDLMLLRAVNLGIEHGHSDASANVYTCMHQIFAARYGDHGAALPFGELALHLVDERGLARYRARVYMVFGTFVVPWSLPARRGRDYIRRAFDFAVESGDHTFAMYCPSNQVTGMLFAGEFLGDVRATVTRGLALVRDANFRLVINSFLAKRAFVTALQDGVPDPLEEPPPVPVEGAPVTLVDLAYWGYRMQRALLFGDLADAVESRRRADACSNFARSFAERAELPYYGALTLLALPARDAGQQAALRRHMEQLDEWASACPMNFVARRELVRAEYARVAGVPHEASEAYAKAVSHARRHGFTQVEAYAAELAARFHAARGEEVPAQAYLNHARGAWQRWGATAKVRQLQADYPDSFGTDSGAPGASRLQELDVQAVLRISNALASNIVPARLVETLLRTALESAGADQGALVLLQRGVWRVPARAHVLGGAIVVSHEAAVFSSDTLPVSIVHAVARTQEKLVLDDVCDSPAYAQDGYVRRQRPRSVLCVPLMRYAMLVGVLYLENNLAANVFTSAKAALLEVVASQAAFALENARLYEELFEQNRQRAKAEDQLRNALGDLERASRLKAMGELVASIVHEVGQPLAAVDTSASAALRWLNREPPEIGEARDMLTHISLSATRARAIIHGLRAKARRAEPQFATLDLNEALREAAALVAGQLEAMQITLELRGLDCAVQVRGDRIQLQQVAINLLTNGAEAMVSLAHDERKLRLICTADEGAPVCVSVEDKGSGIDPQIAERLLEPLFTTKENGMGMGLAICNSIVEAHGGTLTLSPRDVQGTRATFTLPRLGSASPHTIV